MRMCKKLTLVMLLSLLMLTSLYVLGRGKFQTFAQPSASFTGIIYDRGVDTDASGYFDYLEVGVEVNVATAGSYQVYVSGLEGDSKHVYVSDYEVLYLDVGVQVVNLCLYGPTIYSSRVNPANVSYIDLYKMHDQYWEWQDNLYDVPLSQEYFYYEFDSPFTDMEAKFTVYPDGRVIMGGTLNMTHMTPPYEGGIEVFGDTSFTRIDGSTEMLADFTFIVQPQLADTFPFNSSSFNLFGTYSGDMVDISIAGSVAFPPSLASQLPLNVSDFTVVANYLDNEITGTITAPLISGMPVASITVDFHGNLTDLYLSDDLEIVYGTFFGYEVNETMVEDMLLQLNSTIPGTGPGSLYEATGGILECTRLDTTMTKRMGGATITFDAHIHGDFIQMFVFYMTGGREDSVLYWFADTLISSVETGDFTLAYAHEFGEASMQLTFTANLTKLWLELESTLPEEIPPQQRIPIELLLNTTLCSVDSADVSWTYENGRSNLHVNAMIGPDLNAELNFIKNVMVTYGMPQPPPLQWQFINETEIDLSNLSVTVNFTRTSILGTIEGFEVISPLDPADSDPTQFKLERFLNLINAPGEPPTKDSRLKITIEGGYNSSHTVTLLRPPTTPKPNITSPDLTSMVWLNQSLSSLKDLIFDIKYQGVFVWNDVPYRVIFDSNSTVAGFNFNLGAKQFSFTVEGPPGTVGFCNVSIPKALLNASREEWIILVDGEYPAECNITESETHTFIYFTYEHSVHPVTISGTSVIYEFNAIMLLPFFMIAALIVAVVNNVIRRKEKDNSAM